MAAAQHIFWDGTELFKHVLCPGIDLANTRDWQPGLLCLGAHRLSRRRWNFWKDGFKKVVEASDRLSEECKKVSRKAATLMGAIEESMTF